jgi:hypothetical protein
MNALSISLVLQNNKKVLSIKDVTPLTIDTGWGNGTPFDFNSFFDTQNVNYPTTDIIVELTAEIKTSTGVKVYNSIMTRDDFGMATIGNLLIDSPSDVFYNIAFIGGEFVPIAYTATNVDSFDDIPDGIYKINYTIQVDTAMPESDGELESEYVLTDTADEVIKRITDNVTDKMFINANFDLEEILDYLVYAAMHSSLATARLVSARETILNTLDHINNEDYEYFTD